MKVVGVYSLVFAVGHPPLYGNQKGPPAVEGPFCRILCFAGQQLRFCIERLFCIGDTGNFFRAIFRIPTKGFLKASAILRQDVPAVIAIGAVCAKRVRIGLKCQFLAVFMYGHPNALGSALRYGIPDASDHVQPMLWVVQNGPPCRKNRVVFQ